jgi:hypothetical protein
MQQLCRGGAISSLCMQLYCCMQLHGVTEDKNANKPALSSFCERVPDSSSAQCGA